MGLQPPGAGSTTIHDLPSELLTRVFIFYCLQPPTDEAYIWTQAYLARERDTLAQVCLSWKGVVFSSPELWTEYRLFFRNPVTSANTNSEEWFSPSQVVDRAVQWLDRSKELPCKVTVWDQLDQDSGSEARISEMFESLRTFFSFMAGRLSYLKCRGPTRHLHQVWSSVVPPLPRLEHLTFSCFGYANHFVPFTPPHSFRDSKLLKELNLLNCSLVLSLRSDANSLGDAPNSGSGAAAVNSVVLPVSLFSYTEITSLELSSRIFPEVILDILPHCLSVVTCTLSIDSWHGDFGGRPISSPRLNQIPLLTLKKLHITTFGTLFRTSDLSPFFTPLRLPALTHLTIQLGEGIAKRIHILPALLDLHRRDPFELKYLKLESIYVEDRLTLFEFFGNVPTLKSLHLLDSCTLGNPLFQELTLPLLPDSSRDHQTGLLPVLEEIELNEQDAASVTSKSIIDFVESRFLVDPRNSNLDAEQRTSRRKPHLQSVSLCGLSLSEDADAALHEKAKIWKEHGLEISWQRY
ncbi:hypothetical protein BDN72DRAFT_842683 [Pluteus cervinus]|uniref:Uncharacterized protein n=1 Tax=Pluteus cervinus TaxID=181527 RepID=A0ACD3AQZ2_9AGAR|nr:hypothetical protein BDN72DRAFT_842683 [Pluteus cervinus]